MHHFIYPSQDTYITNRTGFDDKNFGLDEILQIGTTNQAIQTLNTTKDYVYVNVIFDHVPVTSYTGTFSGSFSRLAGTVHGTLSGSNLMFSSSYFSGSVTGSSIVEYSGSVSGSANGYVSGSFFTDIQTGVFIGSLTSSVACLYGTGSGTDVRNEQNWTTATTKFIDRTVLQFDLTEISNSLASGTISQLSFTLKMKVIQGSDVPLVYTVYALPISQSWDMGDGYFSDGGSDEGVSWRYRDGNGGMQWYSTYTSSARPPIDVIHLPTNSSESFAYGGGTWYEQLFCSQSFGYQTADIEMDVTPMVMAWITGSIPNEGMLLFHSDELQSTGSGFILKFFSRDTNTIYSPYLDAKWSDFSFTTGSFSTSSVQISLANSGISASVQSGSTFRINGGVSGSFSASAFLNITPNYVTATEQIFNYSAPSSVTSDTWWANNGYHYDSWLTSWQLDPFHGGFLPNTDITLPPPAPDYGSPPVLQFTGSFTGSFSGTASYVNGTLSGSGIFYTDFFTGGIDNVFTTVTSGSVSGSLLTGSIEGIVSASIQTGFFAGQLVSPRIFLNGTGSGTYLDSTYLSFGGFTNGTGLTGNITGVPVFGEVLGLVTVSESLVTGPCGKSFSASLAKAVFTNGPFSGSAFTAFYVDYKFENAVLTGSWIPAALLGATVYILIPSGIDPYAYAKVQGTYVNGTALGLYLTSGSTSASFNGQFVDGNLLGGFLSVQLSGSVYTSSFYYTSSVSLTSSFLNALDAERPFSIALQGVRPTYRMGDIAKIGVFGRKQYPLKYFGKSTQQEQYLVPEFLPLSSYYALKDNQTEEYVMDFDSYTQISCEYPYGNYFMLDTSGLLPERYYRVIIRVMDGGETYTIDTGKTFKLTR